MQINLKANQKNKTKALLKKNNFLFFALGANQNAQNWLILEQSLNKLTIAYTKTYKNVTKKILQDSILKRFKSIIHSTFFFFKPKTQNQKTIIKSNIVNKLGTIQFTIVALKLNKKIYSRPQLETLNSYNYKKNVSLMYQFLITSLKSSTQLKQK